MLKCQYCIELYLPQTNKPQYFPGELLSFSISLNEKHTIYSQTIYGVSIRE